MPLPRGVTEPYTVYLNGVRQEPGRDFEAVGGVLIFEADLEKEGKLSLWRWFLGAWGIGTYNKDDQVDVSWWNADGQPLVAQGLEIERGP